MWIFRKPSVFQWKIRPKIDNVVLSLLSCLSFISIITIHFQLLLSFYEIMSN